MHEFFFISFSLGRIFFSVLRPPPHPPPPHKFSNGPSLIRPNLLVDTPLCLPHIASHGDVLRGSSRVPANPLRTSAGKAMPHKASLISKNSLSLPKTYKTKRS